MDDDQLKFLAAQERARILTSLVSGWLSNSKRVRNPDWADLDRLGILRDEILRRSGDA